MARFYTNEFESQVFGPAGASQLAAAVDKFGSAEGVISAIRPHIPDPSLYSSMQEVALLITPEHRGIDLGTDELVEAPKAFFNGARLALSALKLVTSQKDLVYAQQHAPIAMPDTEEFLDDVQAYRHAVATTVMHYGEIGFAHAEAYETVFERVEDQVSPLVSHLKTAKAGFGFPFYIVKQAVELDARKDLEQFASELDRLDDSSWDMALLEGIDTSSN